MPRRLLRPPTTATSGLRLRRRRRAPTLRISTGANLRMLHLTGSGTHTRQTTTGHLGTPLAHPRVLKRLERRIRAHSDVAAKIHDQKNLSYSHTPFNISLIEMLIERSIPDCVFCLAKLLKTALSIVLRDVQGDPLRCSVLHTVVNPMGNGG